MVRRAEVRLESLQDVVHAVSAERGLERPDAGVGESLLVGVEDVGFAGAAGALEEGFDGV